MILYKCLICGSDLEYAQDDFIICNHISCTKYKVNYRTSFIENDYLDFAFQVLINNHKHLTIQELKEPHLLSVFKDQICNTRDLLFSYPLKNVVRPEESKKIISNLLIFL